MMRAEYGFILLLLALVLVSRCNRSSDKPGVNTLKEQGTSITRGGWWAPLGDARRKRCGSRTGPEEADKLWSFTVPVPAVLNETSFFEESPSVVVDSDGNCYVLALAIPAVEREMRIERKALNSDSSERNTHETMELGAASMSHDLYADIAPKEAWLYSLASEGGQRWVLKVPGAPVGAPSITPDGNIVFGTYSQQVVDFNRSRSERGDPVEDVGAVHVVSPGGKLIDEISPGGWICAEVVVADDGTILASVNDSGHGYRTPEMGARLVALEPDGTVRWEIEQAGIAGPPAVSASGVAYVPVETAHGRSTTGTTESQLLAVELSNGQQLWRYDCVDEPVAELACGGDGRIYCGVNKIWPEDVPLAGSANFDPDAANQLGKLMALDETGKLLWSIRIGAAFWEELSLGDDGSIYLLCTEWGPPKRPNLLFSATWQLKSYTPDGETRWTYHTEYNSHFNHLAVDAVGNAYLSAVWVTGWNPGVIAVTPEGLERWRYYTSGTTGSVSIVNGGELLLAAGDTILALGESE